MTPTDPKPTPALLACPSLTRAQHVVAIYRGVQDCWVLCSCGFAGPRRSSDEDAAEAWAAGRPPLPVEGAPAAGEVEGARRAQHVDLEYAISDIENMEAMAETPQIVPYLHHLNSASVVLAAFKEVRAFLTKLAGMQTQIVSSASCHEIEIAEARVDGRWYVDAGGLGFVIRRLSALLNGKGEGLPEGLKVALDRVEFFTLNGAEADLWLQSCLVAVCRAARRLSEENKGANPSRDAFGFILADLRDTVLNGRGALEGGVLDNDQTNAVLDEIDNAISAYEAVPVRAEENNGEPVAWLISDAEGNDDFCNNPSALDQFHYRGGAPRPLYLRPAAPVKGA